MHIGNSEFTRKSLNKPTIKLENGFQWEFSSTDNDFDLTASLEATIMCSSIQFFNFDNGAIDVSRFDWIRSRQKAIDCK